MSESYMREQAEALAQHLRLNDGKSGYLGQSVLPIYFGLGAAEKASSVEVTWPSGRKQVVTSPIPQNGLLTVQESR